MKLNLCTSNSINTASLDQLEKSFKQLNVFNAAKQIKASENHYLKLIIEKKENISTAELLKFLDYLDTVISEGEKNNSYYDGENLTKNVKTIFSSTEDQIDLLKFLYSRTIKINSIKNKDSIDDINTEIAGLSANIAYQSVIGPLNWLTKLDDLLIDTNNDIYVVFDGVSCSDHYSTLKYQEIFKKELPKAIKKYENHNHKLDSAIKALDDDFGHLIFNEEALYQPKHEPRCFPEPEQLLNNFFIKKFLNRHGYEYAFRYENYSNYISALANKEQSLDLSNFKLEANDSSLDYDINKLLKSAWAYYNEHRDEYIEDMIRPLNQINLLLALKDAHANTYAQMKQDPKAFQGNQTNYEKGSHTTMAGFIKMAGSYFLINIGDSHANLINANSSKNIMTRSHARGAGLESSLSLTNESFTEPAEISIKELNPKELKDSNMLLLATDGVTTEFDEAFLNKIDNASASTKETVSIMLGDPDHDLIADDITTLAIKFD